MFRTLALVVALGFAGLSVGVHAQDGMKKDAMSKGDAMKKDNMSKGDAMKKDAMKKDEMSKGGAMQK